MQRKLLGLVLVTLVLGAAPGLAAYAEQVPLSARGTRLDRVVAIVNDGVVLQSELDTQMTETKNRLKAQNIALPDDSVLRKQLLDRLVLEEIQAQRADKTGIHVSDEQLNAALEDIAKRNNIGFADLPERLASEGIDYATYRSDMKREIQRELLRQRDVLQRISITPRELEQYMDRQKHTASANNEYNVSHILLAVAQDAPPAKVAAARQKGEDLIKRARGGEDFAQLAIANSASQTALNGGSLGWRKGPELPTFLADTVGRMQPGEVSDLIQTASGFNIVKLNEIRSIAGSQLIQQVHLRHILIKTTEVQDDATVKAKLTDMRNRILAGTADFAVLAKATSEDPGSAVNGGDLGWTKPDVFVPEFTAVAMALKDNEISQPFKSEYGWHIVQMLGRRQFDNTETAARDAAYRALRESRLDETTEIWLQELKDDAYVEILG
ncbi:MAG TPA: peptidylprolyl isomerase [Steroidobacteraceae bacterium]|nr:peptidylprolyl isomerase [Steroidobacteraceae bacterium]